MASDIDVPLSFHPGLENCPLPQRAQPAIDGSASHRASLYCHPFLTANSFGWHIFPPLDADLEWDGSDVHWRPEGASSWNLLDTHVDVASFGYLERFAPEHLKRFMHIPLLAAGPEMAIVQIWSGLFVSSLRGWCTLVRPTVNRRRDSSFDVLEGLIDTDWWLGPLVFPIQIRKTDCIIRLRRNKVIAQVQPIHRDCFSPNTLLEKPSIKSLDSWGIEEWTRFQESMELREKTNRPGSYRSEARAQQRNFLVQKGNG